MILHLSLSELQYASQQDCVLMEEQLEIIPTSSLTRISVNLEVAVVSIVEATLLM